MPLRRPSVNSRIPLSRQTRCEECIRLFVVFVRWCSSLLGLFYLIYFCHCNYNFSSCALLFGLERKGFILCGFKGTRSLVNTGLTPLVFVRGQCDKRTNGRVCLSVWSVPREIISFHFCTCEGSTQLSQHTVSQYVSSPGNRADCYTQNSPFFPQRWPKPSPVFIVSTQRGMTRLSGPEWPGKW